MFKWLTSWKFRWIAWLVPGIYLFILALQFLQTAVKTQGVVTAMIPQRGKNGRISYRAEVSFREIGDQGETWDTAPSIADLSMGQTVGVYYDPKNPVNAKVDMFWELWLFPIMATSFGLFLLYRGWKNQIFMRNKQSDGEVEERWWEGEPKTTYRPSVGNRIMISTMFYLLPLFLIVIKLLGDPHSHSWTIIGFISYCCLLFSLLLQAEIQIFEKGFVCWSNPLFAVHKAKWGEVTSVKMGKYRGMSFLVLKFLGEGSSFSVPTNFLGNKASDGFVALLLEKSPKADYDENVLGLLSVKD